MIQLKGYKAGLLKCIVPDDISERQMIDNFLEIVENAQNLLDGNGVIMEMNNRIFSPSLIAKIWKSFVEPSNCNIIAWICKDEETKQKLNALGLETEIKEAQKQKDIRNRFSLFSNDTDQNLQKESYIHAGNLRGGQKIEHDGDVVVLGHVHMGADIIAKGNITVLGKLQGIIHAGCDGDNTKKIFVRSLESGQVRIGSKAGWIDKNSEFWRKPVVISLNSAEDVLVANWPII
ncbi:MAG: septum site-determining protein MinC [Synergistaceae bacterium]